MNSRVDFMKCDFGMRLMIVLSKLNSAIPKVQPVYNNEMKINQTDKVNFKY